MSTVRIRSIAPDPFNGARGHDYIKLRDLAKRVAFQGEPSQGGECQCAPCVRDRLLPAVQRICASPVERRKPTVLQAVPWNDLTNEVAQDLLAFETEA